MSRIPWDRVIIQETVKSLMANKVTKSNTVVEVYVGSAMTIDKFAPMVTAPHICRQKWVEEQYYGPNIGEIR